MPVAVAEVREDGALDPCPRVSEGNRPSEDSNRGWSRSLSLSVSSGTWPLPGSSPDVPRSDLRLSDGRSSTGQLPRKLFHLTDSPPPASFSNPLDSCPLRSPTPFPAPLSGREIMDPLGERDVTCDQVAISTVDDTTNYLDCRRYYQLSRLSTILPLSNITRTESFGTIGRWGYIVTTPICLGLV